MTKNRKAVLLVLLISLGILLSQTISPGAEKDAREKILYTLSPLGKAVYEDWGITEKDGKKLLLVTFKTQVFGFKDTEKIYIDPDTYLPVSVERDIKMWGDREYLTEDYDQKNFVLTIKKIKNNKEVKGYVFKKNGVIHNAVYLPFYLRTLSNLKIGWSFVTRFPTEFQIRLASIEEITTPAGKFMTYHFISTPQRFEIWISKENPRVPVKIKDTSGLGYTLVIKERTINPQENNAPVSPAP